MVQGIFGLDFQPPQVFGVQSINCQEGSSFSNEIG